MIEYFLISTQPKAINPRKRIIRKERNEDEEENDKDDDKIDPFGDNPTWDMNWVKAHKINYLGRVC